MGIILIYITIPVKQNPDDQTSGANVR